MIEMHLPYQDLLKMKIDGETFELQKTDTEIIRMIQDAKEKYEGKALNGSDEILSVSDEITGMIDEILGKGAAKKLRGGREPNLTVAYKQLNAICKAAVQAYAEAVADYYA